jgi:ubiquinone/menaquinone biosynthesis C-methylase UbiE
MNNDTSNSLLAEQIAYYRARAAEYDEWFLRLGRYDRGEEQKRQWFTEVEQVRQALAQFAPAGRILEFAGGTGWWTQELVRYADTLTVVDSSSETIALNQERVAKGKERSIPVRYVEADIFSWQPEALYDVVFFSFWLSHVPPEQLASFWNLVRACLAPGGRVFFIDSLYSQTATAADQRLEGEQETTMERRLNDGRTFRIVKVFYRPDDLQEHLMELGWQADLRTTSSFFLFGLAQPLPSETAREEKA